MGPAARERKRVVHDLAERVQILVAGIPLLRASVTDTAALELLGELEDAALRCVPLFDRLRKVL